MTNLFELAGNRSSIMSHTQGACTPPLRGNLRQGYPSVGQDCPRMHISIGCTAMEALSGLLGVFFSRTPLGLFDLQVLAIATTKFNETILQTKKAVNQFPDSKPLQVLDGGGCLPGGVSSVSPRLRHIGLLAFAFICQPCICS